MDKIALAKWFVCAATLVVVVLLAVSLDKLNKKKTGGGNNQVGGRKGRRRVPGPSPAPSPSPSDGCPDPVPEQPRPYKGAPNNCMSDIGVNMFGKPCCTKSDIDKTDMQVFARSDGECVCIAPGSQCAGAMTDACDIGNYDVELDPTCVQKFKQICGV